MMTGRHRVLLVEDNPGDTLLTCERLSAEPESALHIDAVPTLAEAVALLASESFDAVLLDLDLPDSLGLQTLRRVREVAGDAPVVVLTGRNEPGLRPQALAAGAEDVFDKDEASSRLFYRAVLYGIERNRARAEHRRLEALLDAMPDAVVVVNAAGAVRYVNQAAVDLFGMPREELEAERLTFSTRPDEPVEITIRRPGDHCVCEMRAVQTTWDGELAQLASVRDITARKLAEQLRTHSAELKLQNQRISEASRLKGEFLATISHEIRTPMNAIVGLSYLLEHTRLDTEQADLLAKVQVASRTLMGLMNDVLDLSKIEAGEVLLESSPFDMPELLRELGQLIAPLARGKPVQLVIEPPPTLPQRLCGDVTRIRQILINLLANSIKFTDRGEVRLSVARLPRADKLVDLQFTVRDTGIGMSPDSLQRIFRRYKQSDATITRRFGGTGLGLSIVRQLVDLMGGDVQVSSQMGLGSEFRVTLPLRPAAEAADGAAGAAPGLRLLVAEPGPDRRPGVRPLARAMGWQVEALESVAAMLARLKTSAWQAQVPDALLIDPQPGDAEALHELVRLRAARGRRVLPPIVVVTDADTPESADLLADARLPRPATAAALFNALNGVLVSRGGARERLACFTNLEATGAQCLAGVRVLVVDDSDINRVVASRILEREGAVTRGCGSGREALQALRQDPSVDLVLMDLQMPEMDGAAATRAIRGELGLAQLPIVALTAGALEAERQRARDAGMDDFICKPLNPFALVVAVRRHVERTSGQAIALRPRAAARERAAASAWPAIEGIDGAEVARRLDGDAPLFLSLLGSLLSEYADLRAEHQPLPDDDAGRRALGARLHRLRGSAGILGATTVHRLATELEGGLKQAATVPELRARLAPLVAALVAALDSLDRHARPWLDAKKPPAGEEDDCCSSEGPSPACVKQLMDLLQTQDLQALRVFRSMSVALRGALAPERYAGLQKAIEGLEFRNAAALLQHLAEAA
ncbi:MAG: response regulator [Rubrivivax sp.]|nr:response regulator [Rubrivivax sp.]